jgi:benzoyl-CoA reductase subunit C
MDSRQDVEDMKPFLAGISQDENSFLHDAKSSGKKIIGYFCSYMPLELFHAAGVVPYRIRGIPDRDIGPGTTYLSSRICTFCRNALTLAIEGDFFFLDGLVGCNTCDQVRRTCQNWIIKKPPEFTDFIHTPRVYRKDNVMHYADQILHLKDNLEGWLGKKIHDDDLREACTTYNRARGILRQLSDLRKGESALLSGAEMITLGIAYHQMPVDSFIAAADDLLEKRLTSSRSTDRTRVVLCGSLLDEPEYVSFIEAQEFDVVAEPICFGQRSYWDDVDLCQDPLTAIAERSLTHFPCARIGDSFPSRWERTYRIYKDYHAEGIIFQRLKFCQLWGVDVHNMSPYCYEYDIPLLQLEREYGFFSTGQLKTRLQAFKELIKDRNDSMP